MNTKNINDEKPATWRQHVMSAAQLNAREFPAVTFVVDGLIPEGLTILAGKPKIGKSWMALELCCGVATGAIVLGRLPTKQGDVLYCALEDNPRRLKHRLGQLLLLSATAKWPEGLTLATQWRRLDEGGVTDIAEWLASASNPQLVVLDTLAGIRPQRLGNEALYDGDYRALRNLHWLAAQQQISILVLHHTRKQEADDPLDTVSGTLGLAGCADTVLVLARTPQGSTIYVRGRDVEECEHAINFDSKLCHWIIQGEAGEVRQSDTRKAILAVLANASAPMSPQDIAVDAGLAPDNVRQTLRRMTSDGAIYLMSRGQYSCTPPPVTEVTASQAGER